MKSIHHPDYVRVIKHLKQRRRELGMTQEAVARALDLGRTTISKIESQERRADLRETYLLCRLYGLQFADLEPVLAGEGIDHVAED